MVALDEENEGRISKLELKLMALEEKVENIDKIRHEQRMEEITKIKALESDMKELKEDLIKKFETLLEDIGDSTILPNLTKLMEGK